MPQRSRAIVRSGDPLLGLFCLLAAYFLMWRHQPYVNSTFTTHRSIQDFCAAALLALSWHWSFTIAGLYRPKLSSFFNIEPLPLLRAALIAPLPIMLCWGFTRDQRKSDLTHALYISFLTAFLLLIMFVVFRKFCTFFKKYLWYGNLQARQVLVVGTNDRAMKFVVDSMQNPDIGFECMGFVDDGWFSTTSIDHSPIPLEGNFRDLPVLLRQRNVNEVVISLPLASFYKRTAEIIELCAVHGIRVQLLGQLFETQRNNQAAHRAGELSPVLPVHDPSWNEFDTFTKRFFDVLISSVLLIICLPVLLLIACVIKLTSDGPVFFRQVRLGQGKKHFEIYKFRTMVDGASKMMSQVEHLNETGGPTFKLTNDPRVTKVGSFLRKSSLDELPQLINVLIGDMSLVGPRPLPVRDYEGFTEDKHRRRFSVKPGITCLWQITGRSNIKFDEWMALDSKYIDQRTFWLDLKILIQTVPAVLNRAGAV